MGGLELGCQWIHEKSTGFHAPDHCWGIGMQWQIRIALLPQMIQAGDIDLMEGSPCSWQRDHVGGNTSHGMMGGGFITGNTEPNLVLNEDETLGDTIPAY
jgi:hypothetical protein